MRLARAMNNRQLLAAAVAVLALGRCAFHVYEATHEETYEFQVIEAPATPSYQYDPEYLRLDPQERAMVDQFHEVMQEVEEQAE